MFDKPQASHSLGLDIDGTLAKGAALSYARGKPKLDCLFEFPVETSNSLDSENVKPLYTTNQKEQLVSLAHKNLVVTILPTQEVLVRPLDLKIKKEKDINAVLAFQSEPLLPYPVENALVDKIIISKDKEGHKLTIIAARKDHLTNHIKFWNSLDVEPEDITATPASLATFAKNFSSQEGMLYVLHIGLVNSCCILVDKGKLLAAQSISKGVNSLIQALALDKNIDFDTAKQMLPEMTLKTEIPSTLKESIELLRLDITRTTYSLAKQAKGQEINQLLLTGEGSCLNDLADLLCSPLNKTLLTPQPQPNFAADIKQLQQYAIPIGAALSVLPNSQEQINFRQHEYNYPTPWKRLKQPIALYLLLCFGIAVSLVLFGKAYLSYKENDLKRHYLELLNVMNKPYTAFEKEFAAKVLLIPDASSSEVPALSSLSQEDIKGRLNFLEKELQSMPQFYPLQPNVPSVSDVLAWLASHPNAVGPVPTGGGAPPALQIENFNYTILKRPELAKKQEKYQVKVELEFSSPTPKMAREFHDALVAPNEIVDAKGEIKWSSNRDKYRTSFYLKDKTVYPNS
ncbi:MAG: pilus assembly protein PilM [Parachlamydiaceae bacterium]|nr:pilus assembly protein PilM [Parachlamydiaceae bacterium]